MHCYPSMLKFIHEKRQFNSKAFEWSAKKTIAMTDVFWKTSMIGGETDDCNRSVPSVQSFQQKIFNCQLTALTVAHEAGCLIHPKTGRWNWRNQISQALLCATQHGLMSKTRTTALAAQRFKAVRPERFPLHVVSSHSHLFHNLNPYPIVSGAWSLKRTSL